MDPFNDTPQIEEEVYFNFLDEEDIFIDEEFDDQSFNEYINATYDFWLWLPINTLSAVMLTPSLVLSLFLQRLFYFIGFSALFGVVLTMFVWHLNKCPLNSPLKPKLLYPEQMTETVNVLPHLNELKEIWRKQDFTFTKQQREEYDLLLAARRERVKYFYDNGLVSKGGLRQKDEDI